MPCGISSVGASSTLITVMVSLSENGSLYPFSTDFSGGTSGADWVPSEELPSRSRPNGKVERKALPLFLHFFFHLRCALLTANLVFFVEICFSVCSSFFVCSSISEVVSFLRFAHNGFSRFSSGSTLCLLFRPYFDVVLKCIGRLKEEEGSHMSSAAP